MKTIKIHPKKRARFQHMFPKTDFCPIFLSLKNNFLLLKTVIKMFKPWASLRFHPDCPHQPWTDLESWAKSNLYIQGLLLYVAWWQ